MVAWQQSLVLLCTVGSLLVSNGRAQVDPIENCLPKPTEPLTIYCNDRQDFCDDLDLTFIYDPDTFCKKNQTAFIDPKYPCNCNILCVDALEEGATCLNTYTNNYPEVLCGIGLDCLFTTPGPGYACQRNPDKKCTALIIEYEEDQAAGDLAPGKLYPNCNNVGEFDGKQCSTSSTCYCTDSEGNRLFGEAPYTEADSMDCECSRHWMRNDHLGLTQGLRCLHNGNLDPLQCNEDYCFCYNNTISYMTQGPYHHSQIPIMDCFDPTYHKTNYTNPCTIVEQRYLEENPEGGEAIVIGVSQKPNCGLDGNYASMQSVGLDFYCSDSEGNQIEDFIFGLKAKADTSCFCATRRHLMRSAGLTSFLPDCCPDGNFVPYQTRGLYSYCVDINGNQKGAAVPVTDLQTLPCADEACQPAF